MDCIIQWCNDNDGFLSAILSVIGLIISIIAIVVSIRTARLPFKKKLKMTVATEVFFGKNENTNDVVGEIKGIAINIINIGNRDVDITYLGIMVNDSGQKNKMQKIKEPMDGMGIIHRTEIHTNSFLRKDIVFNFSRCSNQAKVYAYAEDSEGKQYKKYIGNAKKIAKYYNQ